MAKRSNKLSEIREYSLSKVMSMSRKDLAKATSTLAQAGNKRLKRFQEKNITTPATEYIKKHGGRFSTKGKDLNELREEFQRAKGFLESKTSTIKGFREWESGMAATLYERTSEYETRINPETGKEERVLIAAGIDYNSLTEREKRKFWKAYSKLEELDAANVYGAKYRTSINEIYTAVKGGLRYKDIDALVNKMNKRIYEESSKNFLSGVNDPFNLIDDSDNPFLGG